jgi:hypothetical protein
MNGVVSVGIVGLSEGNGHPFSFSAIINGYSDEHLRDAGWETIYNYLRVRDRSEFGIGDLRVTHAWTQDAAVTERLCKATFINNAVPDYRDMVGAVDAVIIARDDHENHAHMAAPFLDKGIPVFIDKPLSLNADELRYFRPYLEKGALMTASGLRYARELDEMRVSLGEYGRLKLVRGTVVNGWDTYGVHMVEAIVAMLPEAPVSVQYLPSGHYSVTMCTAGGPAIQIDALGRSPKVFRIDLFGEKRFASADVSDNFTMFRRMLWRFAELIRTGGQVIPVEETMAVMKVLIAAELSRNEKRTVDIDDIQI